MALTSRIPTQHKQVLFTQSVVERAPSPFFAPPVPAYMREPGTNYITIVTADTLPGAAKVQKVPRSGASAVRPGVPAGF
jgi:hypothetical protein